MMQKNLKINQFNPIMGNKYAAAKRYENKNIQNEMVYIGNLGSAQTDLSNQRAGDSKKRD